MAEEKKSSRNFVLLVGSLKETTLELKTDNEGKRFVSGNVTVAVDEFNTHRVRFLVFENQLKDKFDSVCGFLPSNVVSIASYLKANPTANFEVASKMAAKVWVTGSLEEYVKVSGENEKSSVTINGMKIGHSEADKFEPKATFELEGNIASLEDEVVDEEETGRVKVELYVPAYKDLIYKMNFVVGTENNAAKFVREKFKAGDGLFIKGNLLAMRIQEMNDDEDVEVEDAFGEPTVPQYTTRFVREMVIVGGHKVDSLFTNKQLKDGLAARLVLAQDRAKKEKARAAAKPADEDIEEASAGSGDDDLDF